MAESTKDPIRTQIVASIFPDRSKLIAGFLDHDRLILESNGHAFGGSGWHIGWAWGTDESGDPYLDVLHEHRMSGAGVTRYRADGEPESLESPSTARAASEDPEVDARLEAEHIAEQRRIVDDLRNRGLLPPSGYNFPFLDINELRSTDRLPRRTRRRNRESEEGS